jgi:hypothetical protein
MTKFAQPNTTPRAPRVKLGGTVLSLLLLENGRQLCARLHQVSTSGGLLHVDEPLNEGIKVELAFHVGKSTVRGKARLFFPMWATQGYLQPFEFDSLAEEDIRKLQVDLQKLLQASTLPISSPENSATPSTPESIA